MSDIFRSGEWCDDNEIVRLVGRGGYAEVYEARDRLRVRRAIKVLDADAELATKLKARFAQEAHALSWIDHPNVVRIFRLGLHGGRLYLLLEFIDGKSLFKRMQSLNGLVPLQDVLRWMRCACAGVAEVHRQDIIHRDLKPSNILITDADVVKVIDFGLAKLRDCGVRTTTEQRLGTALYMAPEILKKAPPSKRTDVYSMGMILYEALAGGHPIGPGPKTLAQIVTWQLTEHPQPLREVAPEVPGNVEFLVHRALDKDPRRRHESMDELAADLNAALGSEHVDLRRAVLQVLPSSDPTLAPTTAMPVRGAPAGASERPIPSNTERPPEIAAHSTSAGGTITMVAIAPAGPASTPSVTPALDPRHGASAQVTGHDRARDAVLPPSPAVGLGGLRTPSRAIAKTTARGTEVMAVTETEPHPLQAPRAAASSVPTEAMPAAQVSQGRPRGQLAATLPLHDTASSLAERRSTGAPVESTVMRPSRGRRALPLMTIAGVLAVLGLAAASWLSFGGTANRLEPAPAASPAASASTTSVRSPTPSNAAPASSASALASAMPASTAKRSRVPTPSLRPH